MFEGTGIKIVSDLPFLSQCETVVDANNVSFSNNSERPVDALAEKHISLTDNLKSRDASASKNVHPL